MKNQQILPIRFEDEVKHQSLYPWALIELDQDGKPMGKDQIPFTSSSWFSATSLEYVEDYKHDGQEFLSGNKEFNLDEVGMVKEDIAVSIDCSRTIAASLVPGRHDIDTGQVAEATWYSFFGTDRTIKDIRLLIQETGEGKQDTCFLEGILSYIIRLDVKEEVVDDYLAIRLNLAQERFNSIAASLKAGEINWCNIMLSGVSGFYSKWSPRIFPYDGMKVLPTAVLNDLKIDNIDEEKSKRLPRLGKVESFSLKLGSNSELLKLPR